MWAIFKVFIEFLTILFLFLFWFIGHKARGILAPQLRMEPVLPALESHLNYWNTEGAPLILKFFLALVMLLQETQFQSLGWEDPLETGMAPHSSILTW